MIAPDFSPLVRLKIESGLVAPPIVVLPHVSGLDPPTGIVAGCIGEAAAFEALKEH